MQMQSCSCVVQSGCTRRATAEHSAEIIHQSKQGTAELLSVGEQNRYAHEDVQYMHTHIVYAQTSCTFIQYMTKVSPAETIAHM